MMKRKIGMLCMILGFLMLAGGFFLFLYNHTQAVAAEQASALLMPQLAEKIGENTGNGEEKKQEYLPIRGYMDLTMAETEIDGHLYIGYLSIPALELELPVMSGWDYPSLQIAPCRYSGTVGGNDLVLMAHNYEKHFGRIDQLEIHDFVLFTDVEGTATLYEAAAVDILAPSAVAEMTSGTFDLTLFTCTYGGQSRIAVYCNKYRGD